METTTEARMLTNEELGAVITLSRKLRQWSQETLAELSGLTTRTIQRVENGEGSNADSRRALAKAFDSEDIDIYNKPFAIPTPEEVERQKVAFERERVTLATVPLTTGKQAVQLAETTQAHLFTTMEDLPPETDMALAEFEELFTDYRDVHDCYSATGKVEMYASFQEKIDALTAIDIELCHTTRRVSIKGYDSTQNPLPFTLLYVLACRKGEMPEKMAVSREVSFGL
jgi:transcriptional regulator with XRE-family HTH domain